MDNLTVQYNLHQTVKLSANLRIFVAFYTEMILLSIYIKHHIRQNTTQVSISVGISNNCYVQYGWFTLSHNFGMGDIAQLYLIHSYKLFCKKNAILCSSISSPQLRHYKLLISLWLHNYAMLLHNMASGLHYPPSTQKF